MLLRTVRRWSCISFRFFSSTCFSRMWRYSPNLSQTFHSCRPSMAVAITRANRRAQRQGRRMNAATDGTPAASTMNNM